MATTSRRRRGLFSSVPAFLVLLATTAFLGATGVLASDDFGIFNTPERSGPNSFFGDNPVYQIGTTLQLQWSTGMKSYRLNIWQQWLNESVAKASDVDIMTKADSAVEPKGTTWEVQLYELDLDISNIFFFSITNGGDLNNGFTSHYFNLTTDPVPSTTTSSLPSSTGTTDPSSSSGSSNDTLKIGLGVGLGVGLPLVALCAFIAGFLIFKRRRNNDDNGGPASQPMMHGHNSPNSGMHGPSPGMQSAYPASVSAYTPSMGNPPYTGYSPAGYPQSALYTPSMGAQQLDGTPMQPPQKHFAPELPPSELPGESIPAMKGPDH